jgi:menaquinone-9 beta-reductase
LQVADCPGVRAEYDVVVVGSRVAGATLAALLGDAGVSVLLIDRAGFPSSTSSTHFFRGAGMVAVLDRLDVLTQVLELGCPPLTHQWTHLKGSGEPIDGPPQNPGEKGYCLSVRREPLDYILVERACRSSNVEFAPRTVVSDLLWEEDRVVGVILRGGEEIRARIVVGADGRHSLVAKKVCAPVQESAPGYRAMYYRYVSGFRGVDGADPDGPEFSLLDDEFAYVFPSDAGMACVAVSINLETFGWLRKDLHAGFESRLVRHEGFAERVRQAQPTGRLQGCGPELSYVRVPFGPGWALVGDAAIHQDPWSGLGIDMAGVHATFLHEAILDWTSDRTDERSALQTYKQRRDEHALPPFRETVTLAADLRNAAPSP